MSLETSAGKATVTQVCSVFGLSRSAYYAARRPSVVVDEGPPALTLVRGSPPARPPHASAEEVQAAIRAIVDDNVAWGVRKVWAVLRSDDYNLKVAHRRTWSLMSAMGLCLPPDRSRRHKDQRGHVVVDEPNRRWSTDLTTVWTRDDGWVSVVPVIDNGCRSIVGIGVTKPQGAVHVLAPLDAALTAEFGAPNSVPDGFELLTDHGSQYTGADCKALCDAAGITHLFAPIGRPTGNAVVERVIRTMKEECIWLRDWRDADEVERELSAWMHRYNHKRPHQALGWQTPAQRRAQRLTPMGMAA